MQSDEAASSVVRQDVNRETKRDVKRELYGRYLLLMPLAHDGLPGLENISSALDAHQITVADHPMQLVFHGDAVSGPCVATIDGFLSDTLSIGINISAPSAAAYMALVAAASTLTGRANGA